MMFDAQGLQVVTEISERLERVDKRKCKGEDKAEQRGNDECHDLVVGKTGREQADGDKGGPEEKQSEVRAPSAAHVQVTHRIAYPIDCYHIHECRQQCDDQQSEAGKEFRPNNLHVGKRKREQEIHGARALLLREGAHRDGRHQKEEQELRKIEKSLQIRQPWFQHIVHIRENPNKQTGDNQKDPDKNVTDNWA